LIQQKTAGNNLSTAFAVEEIKSAHSIEEAYQILNNTRISDSINQYYNHIWAHLKNLLSQIMPNKICPESYVACPLLLMNGRVNTRILTQALQRNISKADWSLLLDHLYPLVIPTNSPDEYTLFHNDFRIYLQSIVYQYKQRYEELAYDLAKYLLENDEGLISYVLGIPLLKHANKVDDIPKYFGTGFVINALAEGISQQRLDDFARDAYQAACANQDIEGYRNVYFALKTIYQHRSYFEYFEREYICLDYPEIEQVDIAEIRTLPISKENLHEYEKVLSLCNKLYSSSRSDSCSRAIGLYNMWFGHLTPLSFISLAEDETGEDDWALKATDVGIMLQHWGHTAAFIERPALKVETDESYLKTYAVMLWGDEYFKCCLDNEKHDLAIAAVQAGVVSRSCVTEKLEQILYDGATDTYKPILQRITYDDENPAEHLLSLAMQVTCCCHFIPKDTATAFSGVNKHIYDASCFELILKAFLQGRLSNGLDDDMVIQAADTLCKGLEKDQRSKEQAIHLARTSALLGKHYWDTDTVSDKLNGYVVWFLTASLYRPYDYSKACHFILYVLLNSKPSSYFAKQKEFLNALHIHLFESRQLGMYYKTHILDFYVQHNMLENIREYIFALYGANCEAISAMENRVDIHRKFSPYGNLVEPEMMQKFSVQLKWDVVGYLGHDEYAMCSPSELFELITKRVPSDWKDLGNILYCQSQIADKSSNKASYQIRANIAEAAAHCSLTDYWELRTWHDDFRLDPDLIIRAIVGAIQRTTTTDDLISLWLLGCGISSWYVPDDHQNAVVRM